MAERLNEYIWIPTPENIAQEQAFIKSEILELGEKTIDNLILIASQQRSNAYVPYSHYAVGAGLLTKDKNMFGGCNSENAGYSPTNHAEGSTIATAISEGQANKQRKFIKAIAISAEEDSGPCGECLQRIIEHTDNCLIIVSDPDGKIRRITSLISCLPYNFNPSHLGK
jgi:cytidine deaminase